MCLFVVDWWPSCPSLAPTPTLMLSPPMSKLRKFARHWGLRGSKQAGDNQETVSQPHLGKGCFQTLREHFVQLTTTNARSDSNRSDNSRSAITIARFRPSKLGWKSIIKVCDAPDPRQGPEFPFLEKRVRGPKNPHSPSPSPTPDKGVFCQMFPLWSLKKKGGF